MESALVAAQSGDPKRTRRLRPSDAVSASERTFQHGHTQISRFSVPRRTVDDGADGWRLPAGLVGRNRPGEPVLARGVPCAFLRNLYLQPTEHDLALWDEAREGYQFLGPTPWPPHAQPAADQPYSREEILAFVEFCRAEVDRIVPAIDLATRPVSTGFPWISLNSRYTISAICNSM